MVIAPGFVEAPRFKYRRIRSAREVADNTDPQPQFPGRFNYIQPGKPQQNAYVEYFNRTVRYEWLSQYYWTNLDEIQLFATQRMYDYNHDRPNMALSGITPKQRLAMAT